MPRQARLDSPGTLHHVIIRGIDKKEIVGDEYDRSDFGAQLAIELTEGYGLALVESGRQLGVSTSAISKVYMRNTRKISQSR